MSQQILETVLAEVKAVRSTLDSHEKQIKDLGQPKQSSKTLFGSTGPYARTGENSLGSRGYSFLKFLGYCAGQVAAEDAKVELDVHNRISKSLVERNLYSKAASNTVLMPFALSHLGISDDQTLVRDLGDLISAGVDGTDPDEVQHYREKYWGRQKAMSWLDTNNGASLVPPAVQGELITLLRNNSALMLAGARDIGMSANGRAVFPRQTDACTAYWVGEGASTGGITESNPKTGDLTLTAKKLGVLCRIPNELFRFASPSIDQFVREDIAAVMGLKVDLTLLEGAGSTVAPKGLINYAGITTHTSAGAATNGDTFAPEDVGDMIAKVEENNAEFQAWIMRPIMYSKIANRRADAVTGGDGKGPWMFNMMRDFKETQNRQRGVGVLEGYRCVKSTQVSKTRTKGSGTTLTYILGGDFRDLIIAMGGAIEFFVANQGGTEVVNDQTLIRGIQYADGGVRREASFVLCDSLLQA